MVIIIENDKHTQNLCGEGGICSRLGARPLEMIFDISNILSGMMRNANPTTR
jgi:hypothetical protein